MTSGFHRALSTRNLTGEALTLVVGRRSGRRYLGGRVNVGGDVEAELRGACDDALRSLEELEYRPYHPDALLADEEYTALDIDEIDDAGGVLELLHGGPTLPLVPPRDLPEKSYVFYGVIIGSTPDDRVSFLSKTNPARLWKPGRFFTTLGNTLTKVDDPILVFEEEMDLIATRDGIAVRDQRAFEQLFRETPVLQERIGAWVVDIAARLPLADDGVDRLTARCRADSRLRRRLQSIHARGHLANVTIDDIRAESLGQGLDEQALIRDGHLVFDDADPQTLLRLLNEDLFTGGLSGARFQVDRKSGRA